MEGAAAYPPDWAERGEVAYYYRDRTLLVRDADVERVTAIVSGEPVAHDDNLRGLTLLEFSATSSAAWRTPAPPPTGHSAKG